MTLSNKGIKDSRKLLEIMKIVQTCPTCKREININIDSIKMDKKIGTISGIFPHLILHGDPIHGLICYFDANMNVRGLSAIDSIEILK